MDRVFEFDLGQQFANAFLGKLLGVERGRLSAKDDSLRKDFNIQIGDSTVRMMQNKRMKLRCKIGRRHEDLHDCLSECCLRNEQP